MNEKLGDRMKAYENCTRYMIPLKSPLIVRLDGCHFHSITRGMKKPFDDDLRECMLSATMELGKKVQNVKFAYTQSDEISLLLVDYEDIKTQSYFENNIQKIVSVTASICTQAFNKEYEKRFPGRNKPAYFDSRVFTLPKEEVVNYFIWRQLDCTRNSIQMVARANFSQKQCHKKNCNDLQEMLFNEKSINWNDYPTQYKRGVCLYKKIELKPVEYKNEKFEIPEMVQRRMWKVDYEMPILTQYQNFIDRFVYTRG